MRVVREGAVGSKDHAQSFPKVALSFFQRSTLGVDAWNFFDVSDIPTATFQINSSKLTNHAIEYSRDVHERQTRQVIDKGGKQ